MKIWLQPTHYLPMSKIELPLLNLIWFTPIQNQGHVCNIFDLKSSWIFPHRFESCSRQNPPKVSITHFLNKSSQIPQKLSTSLWQRTDPTFKNFASSCIFSVQPNINILYYNITQQFLSHSIKTRAASGYTQQPKTKQTRKKVGDTEKLPKLPNKKTDSLYYTLLK